ATGGCDRHWHYADAHTCWSLQFIGAIAADHLEITLGRSLEHAFSVRPDRSVRECTVNAVERVRLERIHDAFDAAGRWGDEVREAPHEAHRLVVLHDLHDVARQERALAACACR